MCDCSCPRDQLYSRYHGNFIWCSQESTTLDDLLFRDSERSLLRILLRNRILVVYPKMTRNCSFSARHPPSLAKVAYHLGAASTRNRFRTRKKIQPIVFGVNPSSAPGAGFQVPRCSGGVDVCQSRLVSFPSHRRTMTVRIDVYKKIHIIRQLSRVHRFYAFAIQRAGLPFHWERLRSKDIN